jgi:hypothetical protein
MLFPASFDERLIQELPLSSLPSDWDLEPPTDSTKSTGDAWVSVASSPVLSTTSEKVCTRTVYGKIGKEILHEEEAIFCGARLWPW